MRYKIRWRAGGQEPVVPDLFEDDRSAKAHVRDLCQKYGDQLTVEVWNEDETWRIVTPAGIAGWCRAD